MLVGRLVSLLHKSAAAVGAAKEPAADSGPDAYVLSTVTPAAGIRAAAIPPSFPLSGYISTKAATSAASSAARSRRPLRLSNTPERRSTACRTSSVATPAATRRPFLLLSGPSAWKLHQTRFAERRSK